MAKNNAQIGQSLRTGPDYRGYGYKTRAVESLVLIMSGRKEFICFSEFA